MLLRPIKDLKKDATNATFCTFSSNIANHTWRSWILPLQERHTKALKYFLKLAEYSHLFQFSNVAKIFSSMSHFFEKLTFYNIKLNKNIKMVIFGF